MKKLPNRTPIVCTEHDGAHEGVIVHDLGFAYAVAWKGLGTDLDVSKAHAKDATHIAYDKVVAK